MLLAHVRLGTAAVAALLPLGVIANDLRQPEAWIALASTFALIALSLIIRKLAARPEPPALLGLFTTLIDVSVVSAGNAAFILAHQPLAVTSGRVYFSMYLIALGLSCIRHDVRLSLVAGITAMVQYTLLVFWALRSIDPAQMTSYGDFRWDNQFARLLILGFATAINVAIVSRGRRFMAAALQDLLTGLANRRFAEARLEEALALAGRGGRTVIVAMADLDRFKRINDQYGHAAGDAVLRETGRRLREFYRTSDLVARYGGEEFLIGMFDTDARALHRLDTFQQEFASTPIVLPNGRAVSVTMSIGLASFPHDATTAAELVAIADARMYEAKRTHTPAPLDFTRGRPPRRAAHAV